MVCNRFNSSRLIRVGQIIIVSFFGVTVLLYIILALLNIKMGLVQPKLTSLICTIEKDEVVILWV